MSIQEQIAGKLAVALSPTYLDIINESSQHNVPPGSESHFKVIIVSQAFEGQSRVHRHRTMNQVLEQELKESIHALSLHTMTPDEWKLKKDSILPSPPCLGGEKGR